MKHPFITAMTLAAATLVGSAVVACAQENYPARPIKVIVPEVVGSAADLMSRIIGQRIGEALGQPVTYENLFLEAGVEKGIKSAPDGYTLIYGSSGNVALLPHVKKVSFDPLKDLTPVARFVIQPTLIAANPSLPVNTLQELVAMMKANPDKLRMSTAGAGTAGHFAGEMFIAMAGIKPVVVHYKGGGPAIDAVVDNDSQWTVAPIGGRMPHVRSGKLKALAMGSPARLALLPNVPTVAESGYPGYSAVGWGAIFVPNGTPQPDHRQAQRDHCQGGDAAGGQEAIRRAGHRGRQQHPGRNGEAAARGLRAPRRHGEEHRAQSELRAEQVRRGDRPAPPSNRLPAEEPHRCPISLRTRGT
jgi:tripartite-type tricarboxylate transporter receptor subunit TctC